MTKKKQSTLLSELVADDLTTLSSEQRRMRREVFGLEEMMRENASLSGVSLPDSYAQLAAYGIDPNETVASYALKIETENAIVLGYTQPTDISEQLIENNFASKGFNTEDTLRSYAEKCLSSTTANDSLQQAISEQYSTLAESMTQVAGLSRTSPDAIDQITGLYSTLSGSIDHIAGMVSPASTLIDQLTGTFRQLTKQDDLSQMLFADNPIYHAFQGLTDTNLQSLSTALSDSMGFRTATQAFLDITESRFEDVFTLATRSAASLDTVLNMDIDIESVDDQGFEEIATVIEERVVQENSNQQRVEFYLGLLVSIFLYLMSQADSAQTEKRLMAKMDEVNDSISSQIESIKERKTTAHFYVVETALNLRVGPSTEHEVITVLPRNQKLIGLSTQAQWMKVEYFDYLADKTISGWVHTDFVMPFITDGNVEN